MIRRLGGGEGASHGKTERKSIADRGTSMYAKVLRQEKVGTSMGLKENQLG